MVLMVIDISNALKCKSIEMTVLYSPKTFVYFDTVFAVM